MVDLRTQVQNLRKELDEAISAVLESGAFVRGPFVAEFESSLGNLYNGANVVGVGNGTDALQLAYMAAGIGPGDEVIIPSFTFFATAEAAALLGATPVFVDIDPKTFNLDPRLLEDAITERTKAIVPVHLFGQPADMNPLMAVANKHNLVVIEDAAQAVGATYGDQIAGLIGDVCCLSFYPSKNLGAYGDGGACISSSDDWASRIRMLANHGSERKYYNTKIGVNSRLDALQAAILSVKLPHLAAWAKSRQKTADAYDERLSNLEWITTPHRMENASHVFHQYTVRVPAEKRDALRQHLKEKSIPSMLYYPVPLHLLPAFDYLEYITGELLESVRASREVLSLPMHPHLTIEQIDYITNALASFDRVAAAPSA